MGKWKDPASSHYDSNKPDPRPPDWNPGMYNDEIDWNPDIDSDLTKDLERSSFVPDEGEDNTNDDWHGKKVNQLNEWNSSALNNENNPWEQSFSEKNKSAQDEYPGNKVDNSKDWHTTVWKRSSWGGETHTKEQLWKLGMLRSLETEGEFMLRPIQLFVVNVTVDNEESTKSSFLQDAEDEVREDDNASMALAMQRTPTMLGSARAEMLASIPIQVQEHVTPAFILTVWSPGSSSVAEGFLTTVQQPLRMYQEIFNPVADRDEFIGVMRYAWCLRHGLGEEGIEWFIALAAAQDSENIWPLHQDIEYVYSNNVFPDPPDHDWHLLQGVIIWEPRTMSRYANEVRGPFGLIRVVANYLGLEFVEEEEIVINGPLPLNPYEPELLGAPPQMAAPPPGNDDVAAPPPLSPILRFDVDAPPSPLPLPLPALVHDEVPPPPPQGDDNAAAAANEEYLDLLVDMEDDDN